MSLKPGQFNEHGIVQLNSEVIQEKEAAAQMRAYYAARAAGEARPATTHRRPKGFLCGGPGNGSGWGGGHYR